MSKEFSWLKFLSKTFGKGVLWETIAKNAATFYWIYEGVN